MPATPHQRLQVITIPPVRSALERISAVTGDRMGSIVRQFLEEALPALEAMADALELVPKNPGEALARMSRSLKDAQTNAYQMGLALGDQQTLVRKVRRKEKAEAKKAAAKKAAARSGGRSRR
jgi:hypothetical protein